MRFKEKLGYMALGGILLAIAKISILQSSVSFLPLAESYSGWTQEQFADWYQRFTEARDEGRTSKIQSLKKRYTTI